MVRTLIYRTSTKIGGRNLGRSTPESVIPNIFSIGKTRQYQLKTSKYNGGVGETYTQIECIWSSSRMNGSGVKGQEMENGQGVTLPGSIEEYVVEDRWWRVTLLMDVG